jgi:uncharacterized secreted protein with C-terminal beta-propeller domain
MKCMIKIKIKMKVRGVSNFLSSIIRKPLIKISDYNKKSKLSNFKISNIRLNKLLMRDKMLLLK